MKRKRPYQAKDIALIIPTKDRPVHVKKLLRSLAEQTTDCGRIILVASGRDIQDVVMSFSDRLPVEYYECESPGQIRQRNMGIQMLDDRTRLVGTLDDDITLKSDALEKMIDFWNDAGQDPVGVGFNVVNAPPHRYSVLKAIFGESAREPGKVLRSGYNTGILNVTENIRTQWLNGGATIWKQSVLIKHPHQEFDSRWAACEDLIFSYPIGKNASFYVCRDAHVLDESVQDQTSHRKFRFFGKNYVLWRLYFVANHKELSTVSCLWSILGRSMVKTLFLYRFKKDQLEYTLGQLEGVLLWAKAWMNGEDPRNYAD